MDQDDGRLACKAAPNATAASLRLRMRRTGLSCPDLAELAARADELMSVVMKIQACAADDPSIAQDTMRLMKAAQGDISGLV